MLQECKNELLYKPPQKLSLHSLVGSFQQRHNSAQMDAVLVCVSAVVSYQIGTGISAIKQHYMHNSYKIIEILPVSKVAQSVKYKCMIYLQHIYIHRWGWKNTLIDV